jgi:hypothetical protein
MKTPILLPPKMYFALLGLVVIIFGGLAGGVIALAWTGKAIPAELGKEISALGAILGSLLLGAHATGDDQGGDPQ